MITKVVQSVPVHCVCISCYVNEGYVTAWEYYSGTAGRDLRFAVFRRQANTEPSECKYTAVGFNYFTSVSGYKREDIGQNHRIRVKQGDHIGLISPSGASIR